MTLKVNHRRRHKDEYMGRFGGGWQWNVGVQAGNLSRSRGTVIINLLVSYVRVSWSR